MNNIAMSLVSIPFFIVLAGNSIFAHAESINENETPALLEKVIVKNEKQINDDSKELDDQNRNCLISATDMQLADVQCGATDWYCPDDRPKCCFDANYDSYYCCASDQNCCIDDDDNYRCCSSN